jgi:hypothetical protein
LWRKEAVMTRLPKHNDVVLQSIPLNRRFKKYWINKYDRMAQNSGFSFAETKFKSLKQVLLAYMSDENRHSHIDKYYRQTGFRVNGMLKQMFVYADCQPHFILDFVKLYSYVERQKNVPQFGTPSSPHELAKATHDRLSKISVDTTPFRAMNDWLYLLGKSPKTLKEAYLSYKVYGEYKGKEEFAKYCKHHTFEQWLSYWKMWYSVLHRAWTIDVSKKELPTYPDMYKDSKLLQGSITLKESERFDTDFYSLIEMHALIARNGNKVLSPKALEFVDSYLDDELAGILDKIKNSAYSGGLKQMLLPDLYGPRGGSSKYPYDINHGLYVGHVDHVPKKGDGSSYRDIAAPNRFIQAALHPVWKRLSQFQNLIPNDASMHQSKFDVKIANRVANANLYVGSVDLSKATDNLPFLWGQMAVERFASLWGWTSKDEHQSWELFKEVSKAPWEDNGYIIFWEKGQPLGSLPSFATLTLTHWLILESISLASGLGHSPYSIVGDDVVIYNKKLRSRYISTLTSRRIPLSLHKSYEGRCVEFAGKTYVGKSIPFFTTDHSIMTWNTVFDYQVATGVKIPWEYLPTDVKRKWRSRLKKFILDNKLPLNPTELDALSKQTYGIAQFNCTVPKGSSTWSWTKEELNSVSAFQEAYTSGDHEEHSSELFSGIVILDGSPVKLLSSRYADKDGWFTRYSPVKPQWRNDKFRLVSTDLVQRAALYAVKHNVEDYSCIPSILSRRDLIGM